MPHQASNGTVSNPYEQLQQRLDQFLGSAQADTLFTLLGGRPSSPIGPIFSNRVGGTFFPQKDSIAINPSHAKPNILGHELAHRLEATSPDLPIFKKLRERLESDFEKTRDFVLSGEGRPGDAFTLAQIRGNPQEHAGYVFDNAIQILRQKHPKPLPLEMWEALVEERDKRLPGIKEAVEFLLEQPIMEEHPINLLREREREQKMKEVKKRSGSKTARDATRLPG